MKALACGHCGDFLALDENWRQCRCGNARMRWDDPYQGTVLVDANAARAGRNLVFIIGLNNHLLGPALAGRLGMWQDFREAHERATDAPHHVFDKTRANCWAVVVRAGVTSDVSWTDDNPATGEPPE